MPSQRSFLYLSLRDPVLENAVEMGLLEKWAVGWRKSASLHCVWCVICMVMSSPNERHGKDCFFQIKFHPLCWEMVTEESVSDHQAGNCNLDLDTAFTNGPDPYLCLNPHPSPTFPPLSSAVL